MASITVSNCVANSITFGFSSLLIKSCICSSCSASFCAVTTEDFCISVAFACILVFKVGIADIVEMDWLQESIHAVSKIRPFKLIDSFTFK